ncbi:MAG TPA: hypothetical protein V6D06_09545 [Trichocoleus sp.]
MSTLAAANSHGAHNQLWLQASVRSFFESMAWDGRPAVAPSIGISSTSESPMTLTVEAFFAAIPWEGQPVIAAPVAPFELVAEAPVPASDDMTLDAFSDLF